MSITKQIDDILEQRHKRAETILQQIEFVKQAKSAAEKIMSMKGTILDKDGNLKSGSGFEKMFASDFDSLSSLKSLSAEMFIRSADKLIAKYEELYRRFSRNTINIAVVGTAKQGKSKFLQTVSGLDDRCIPAFPGDHCTGAVSIIENSDNENVKVELTFKTNQKLLEEAQSYLDQMTGRQIVLSSVDELPSISRERVNACIETLPEGKKANAKSLSVNFFNRFVDHYNEWRGLLGSGVAIKHDENEIMQHVAQHNGFPIGHPERKEFFKFVAVEQAVVKKKYVHSDAGRIQLIDTEGLGANTTNTDANMIETIRDKSDAVIFVKRPEGAVGGTPTSNEIGVFDNLRGTFSKQKMNLWSAFLLNRTEDNELLKFFNNEMTCGTYMKYMRDSNVLPLAKIGIVDVSLETNLDAEANGVLGVVDFLTSFLETLSLNLAEIDQTYIDLVRADAETAYAEYCNLSGALKNIIGLQSGGTNGFADVFQLMQETKGEALAALRSLDLELSKQRDDPCYVVKEKLRAIVSRIFKTYLPEPDEIRAEYLRRGNVVPATLFSEYLNSIRNAISKEFAAVDAPLDALVSEVKDQIADCLLKTGKLGKILPELQERSLRPYEQLAALAEEAMKLEQYPQLCSAINFLTDYELSVRGSLIYGVRSGLYEYSMLNSNLTNGLNFNGEVGKTVNINLEIMLVKMQDEMNDLIKTFYVIPNQALYALCDEFYDRVTFSENVDTEWVKLYGEYQVQIWMDELTEKNKFRDALKLWKQYVEEFDRYKRKANFIITSE